MKPSQRQWSWILLTTCAALVSVALAHAQQSPDRGASSYMPVDIKEPFAAVMARMKAAQPDIQKRQADLLAERYDLADVAQGKLVTIDNYYELFNGILNPKQLEGLRLLLTPFAQQQFNQTEDRRSEKASRGVACFDCHANGHSNGATHESGDVRPQQHRRRIDTPPLRGVNIQRLFGSQRALKTVEDFTEFEQRGAYFDGDMVIATKKGINIVDRGHQVHEMSEFQEILDFPPAPKLNVYGRLDRRKATEAEIRGEELFFGKGNCS